MAAEREAERLKRREERARRRREALGREPAQEAPAADEAATEDKAAAKASPPEPPPAEAQPPQPEAPRAKQPAPEAASSRRKSLGEAVRSLRDTPAKPTQEEARPLPETPAKPTQEEARPLPETPAKPAQEAARSLKETPPKPAQEAARSLRDKPEPVTDAARSLRDKPTEPVSDAARSLRDTPTPDRVAVSTRAALMDVVGIAREVVAWPVRIWLAAAEFAGRGVLWVWRTAVYPVLLLIARVSAWALRLGEREVTPARGLCFVALAATVALGASQFSDYRAVQVGAPQYRSVEGVAPAPEVAQETPRSAHGVAVFAIAIASLFVTLFAVIRNWRVARVLLFLGLAVVLISLLADIPPGLREGTVALDYQGANAVLLGGFWAQLFAGVTLMIVGPLLAIQLRASREARRARDRVTSRPTRLGRAGGVETAT